ncbi:MAG: hypothetical protein ABI759_12310 [Candidatus Solibacter sp.]
MDKVEIECVRRVDSAQSRLHAFLPEPPFGEASVIELQLCERATESARASLDKAKHERVAHRETHAMTLSR